jgi:hypothetical protein
MRTSKLAKALILGGTAWALTACGPPAFVSIATTNQAQAPGSLQIAPKVDVVLVEDDTGRIQESYGQIDTQSKSFLSSLDSQGWNYHFTTLRLTSYGAVTQATASKQDPNWGSQWVSPYPGANINSVDMLSPSIFETLTGYNGFLQPGQATNVLNGQEPGFLTMVQDFSGAFTGTNFLRPDAMLAVVMIGTGNDTSYVNYCHRADGKSVPCEQVTSTQCTSLNQAQPTGFPVFPAGQGCASANLSFNTYLSQIQALRPNPAQLKFYSAVASFNSASSGQQLCAGGFASPGTRYQQMAQALNGQSFDVCSQSLSSILTAVGQNLTTTALAFEKVYLVLRQQPDPNTIQVVKNIGGDPSNQVVIPRDPNNGWEYVGFLNNQPTIDYPVPMDNESGYMIHLTGAAKLQGADSASIIFKTPSGNSVSQ